MRTIGIILIALGVMMLIFKGFSFTKEKKGVDLGAIELNKKENHNINWPAWAGGIAIAAGALVLIASRKKE
jgi:LPXTG-motif cell wall-anchored protein